MDAFYDPDPECPGEDGDPARQRFDGVDGFDPLFFGISPREAELMDPQQRLLLEVAWEALEWAGIAPDSLAGSSTGVFVGISTTEYAAGVQSGTAIIDAYVGTGNALSIAANRLSYVLGLRGPSMAVDTACSSSLVAVHLACQSLRSGESDLALAGGVNLLLVPETMVNFSRARMLSPDGRCKTFDAAADGYVRGEGCGVVVLRRLSDARAAGDQVLAVVRGSAVNQDGRSNGLTAPNGPAQEAVVRRALEVAGVDPVDVGYVEAHGTGTPLGDPIELRALGRVLGPAGPPERPLVVGSVKTNIGHLEAAAGIAGLIKAVLAVHHGQIPAHLNFTEPNPHIPWDELPVVIPTAHRLGPAPGGRRELVRLRRHQRPRGAGGAAGAGRRGDPPAPGGTCGAGEGGRPGGAGRGGGGPAGPVRGLPPLRAPDRGGLRRRRGPGRAARPGGGGGLLARRAGRGAAGGGGGPASHGPRGRAHPSGHPVAFVVPGQGSRLAGAAQDLYGTSRCSPTPSTVWPRCSARSTRCPCPPCSTRRPGTPSPGPSMPSPPSTPWPSAWPGGGSGSGSSPTWSSGTASAPTPPPPWPACSATRTGPDWWPPGAGSWGLSRREGPWRPSSPPALGRPAAMTRPTSPWPPSTAPTRWCSPGRPGRSTRWSPRSAPRALAASPCGSTTPSTLPSWNRSSTTWPLCLAPPPCRPGGLGFMSDTTGGPAGPDAATPGYWVSTAGPPSASPPPSRPSTSWGARRGRARPRHHAAQHGPGHPARRRPQPAAFAPCRHRPSPPAP